MESPIFANVDPNIEAPTTTPSQSLPIRASPCKHVRFADDVIQREKSNGKALVSPPVPPTEGLLERLHAEIAMLPMAWQEALTPAQLRILAGVGKEEQLQRLEAAETLCEMQRGMTRGAENRGACSEAMKKCNERRNPKDTPQLSPNTALQSRGEREEMDPAIKIAREVKTSDPTSPEIGSPREVKVCPDKAVPQKATLYKSNPRKMTRRTVVTPKATPKKAQSRKRSPTKVTIHLPTPRNGISKTAKASPRRFGQAHGSAEKRNLELAWLEECSRVKTHSAASHAQ